MTGIQLDTAEMPNTSTALQAAAEWLSVHRDELADPIIPSVRDRFGFSNAEAIEALRRGRILRWARAN